MFAQDLGILVERKFRRYMQNSRSQIEEIVQSEMEDEFACLSAENEKLKIEHKEEIKKYKIQVDQLKKRKGSFIRS